MIGYNMDSQVSKEAWNLFGKPFGKKEEAPKEDPTPLKNPPVGKGVQKKFWEKAKATPEDDHGVVTQTILANPTFKKTYGDLESAAPKAYALVDKYITKWITQADKLDPAGGLTSREAAEKWAAIWDKKEPNQALADMLEEFGRKYNIEDINENSRRSLNALKAHLNKHLGVGVRKPLTPEEKAIVAFYRKLDKAFPESAAINPPNLKRDIQALKENLANMVSDQSYLKPAVRKEVVTPGSAPEEAVQTSPAQTGIAPTRISETGYFHSQDIPRAASDSSINGTSTLYEDIEIVGPMMEVDSSTDEIENLSKLFQK